MDKLSSHLYWDPGISWKYGLPEGGAHAISFLLHAAAFGKTMVECDFTDFEVSQASQNEVRSGFKSKQHLIMKAVQFLYRFGIRYLMKFDSECI